MEDATWNDFGGWLQGVRKRQGLSQEKLAELMGCTQNYIWRLEKGERCPSKEFLRLLGHELPLTASEKQQLTAFLEMAEYSRMSSRERERERERRGKRLSH
jgi:transcriptional regulator with XRE-family HTH domain